MMSLEMTKRGDQLVMVMWKWRKKCVFHHPVIYNTVDIIIIKILIFSDIYLLIPVFVFIITDKARARGNIYIGVSV